MKQQFFRTEPAERTGEAHVRRCPSQLTGADMYALCADAWMNGLKRLVAEVRRAGSLTDLWRRSVTKAAAGGVKTAAGSSGNRSG